MQTRPKASEKILSSKTFRTMYLVVTLVSIVLSAATVNCLIIAPQLTLDYILFISSAMSALCYSVLV